MVSARVVLREGEGIARRCVAGRDGALRACASVGMGNWNPWAGAGTGARGTAAAACAGSGRQRSQWLRTDWQGPLKASAPGTKAERTDSGRTDRPESMVGPAGSHPTGLPASQRAGLPVSQRAGLPRRPATDGGACSGEVRKADTPGSAVLRARPAASGPQQCHRWGSAVVRSGT